MAEKHDPNLPPPGQQATVNPYGFIMSPKPVTPKKSPLILGPGDSFLKKIALIVGAAMVGLILIIIGANLFLGGKDDTTAMLLSIAQDQQEMIRVSSSTGNLVNATELKNFDVTAQATLASDQQKIIAHISANGGKIGDKTLGLKHDPATDTLLATAKSTNTLDASYAQIMEIQLTTYRDDIKVTFESTSDENLKQVLRSAYASSDLLLQQLAKYTK
ncbi:MAG: hypothetical protein WBP26_05355 [Candidatus Saccharimonadales bacterium]